MCHQLSAREAGSGNELPKPGSFYADDNLLGKNVGSEYFKNKAQIFPQVVKGLV
jgi:hypothetical protein